MPDFKAIYFIVHLYVGHATTFYLDVNYFVLFNSRVRGNRLDFVHGWLVVMHTYLTNYLRCQRTRAHVVDA